MPYDKQTWQNDVAGGTPLSAERLQHIEDGLDDTTNLVEDHAAAPHGGGGGGVTIHTAASEAAMLALSAAVGDYAVRTDFDPRALFVLLASPATSLANWSDMVTADQLQDVLVDVTVSYNDLDDVPTEFNAAPHVLTGDQHTASGLTAGHVLRALSETTFGFGAVTDADLAGTALSGKTRHSRHLYTVPGTYSLAIPSWAQFAIIEMLGAGGPGASGRKGAAGEASTAGAPGGSGGYVPPVSRVVADLGASPLNIVLGAIALGGAAQTTNSSNGSSGTNAGETYIGPSFANAILAAGKGSPGIGGRAATAATGGNGGAGLIAGVAGVNSSATGAAGSAGNNGGPTGGAAAGGGITTANVASAGGNGGVSGLRPGATGPAGGAVGADGASGTDPAPNSMAPGPGGAGGGASTTGHGGKGGDGGPGAGGGGGGSSRDGVGDSGAGGNGGPPKVQIIFVGAG